MAARPSMVVGMAMGLASLSVDDCRSNCNGWGGVFRRGRRSSGAAASGVACGIGWAARSPQALSVELVSSGVARGAIAALGRLLAGAAGRRPLVERLGGGCRWRVVAAELPPQ
ncbi:hypothetical protein [Enorma massiliensis]|uniref:hypothetical protein n=1 Tax=Enorma massiliensis TaxID=1472761 RepID=UPI0012B51986|nr:hypothetical protein [Enorma massiliensis]